MKITDPEDLTEDILKQFSPVFTATLDAAVKLKPY